jgi:hypothetical protein
MHVTREKCTQFSDEIPERKRSLWRPLHRWKTVLKQALTSINATLYAFSATVKLHGIPVVVMLYYVCIVFGVYQ